MNFCRVGLPASPRPITVRCRSCAGILGLLANIHRKHWKNYKAQTSNGSARYLDCRRAFSKACCSRAVRGFRSSVFLGQIFSIVRHARAKHHVGHCAIGAMRGLCLASFAGSFWSKFALLPATTDRFRRGCGLGLSKALGNWNKSTEVETTTTHDGWI